MAEGFLAALTNLVASFPVRTIKRLSSIAREPDPDRCGSQMRPMRQ